MQEGTIQVKASNVGKYVSKALFSILKHQYQERYPCTSSAFIIKKSLIKKVLGMSKELTGIRFMYGLADRLNPNSIRVFLIPCTNKSEYDLASKPLVSKQGYFDHTGEYHSILEIAKMMSHFVESMVSRTSNWPYKEVTRGNFYGKNSLLDLMKDERCAYIKYHFGLRKQVIHPIIEPLNASHKSFIDVFMAFTQPCPIYCGDRTDGDCLTTMAVDKEEELNFYRKFRDFKLLQLQGGAMLYELYYFISPFIASLVDNHPDKEQILKQFHLERILPFKQLLHEGKYQAAVDWLRTTLNELTENYKVELDIQFYCY